MYGRIHWEIQCKGNDRWIIWHFLIHKLQLLAKEIVIKIGTGKEHGHSSYGKIAFIGAKIFEIDVRK